MGTEELHDGVQSWEQYQDRLDCEHRALSALELRVARLLEVPAHLEQAPPTPLCQQLQAMQTRYNSVSKRSSVGLASSRSELEERERSREELQRLKIWLEAADHLLSEPETGNAHEIQEALLQLFTQKALLQRITNSIQTKYSEPDGLIPSEIEVLLQDANQIMQQVEPKVNEAVEKSGPVYRLGAKLSEIQSGLHSLQKRLDQKSPTAAEAKITQKRVWDELDVWHSCLAALEADLQDLDKPQEALVLTERLVEVQQIHSQLAKQAEQRTTVLSKIHTWLQEHQEMINSSKSWINEAKTWLAAPATYTTAKCLSSHVHALQVVLGDSAQIRSTLQGFTLVLEEMSQVCDVSSLQLELQEADREVAQVQDSFTAPLTKLQHAAAEVEAIEGEVRKMENDVAEIKQLLASPESLPSPKVRRLKIVEQKIQAMQRTINDIQSSKPHLELPEKAEETLTVFTVVDHLQILLQELQKKVPALFIQQPDQPRQSPFQPPPEKTTSEEKEEGEIQIVHVKEDVLKVSGAELLTVEQSTAEQRATPTPPDTQVEKAESVLSQVEAELPSLSPLTMGTEELHDGVQSWEQYQDRLDCEHRALSALELRVARLLEVPAHLEQAPPTPLCQQLQAMQTRYNSVSKRSSVGLASSRSELEERERSREELQRLKIWLEAADHLLSEPETGNAHEIQEALLQLFTQKALLQRITNSIQTKYSEPDGLIPSEIEVLLQDANQIMQQVEPKVNEAVEKSGPVYRLGAKLSEIQSGLHSLQKRLDQKSPTAAEAKITQKRVWDELDVWHSCLAALEADLQDLDKPQEALVLTERLVEVQQIHSQLAKQAEQQRTTVLSKIHTWLQEHQEMINSSKSWINEAKTWLLHAPAAPATYTTHATATCTLSR
ncbi:nesprin-2-like [Boleophthalmus pectinirostris]|uniref:nesprin-2-like n=1 Tax=Boleophthalmus pectinirostris TaxID=150288 RepID=UPI0024311B6B|nr:nesprin-2-like [Boleophthalmus pectinirostris]